MGDEQGCRGEIHEVNFTKQDRLVSNGQVMKKILDMKLRSSK